MLPYCPVCQRNQYGLDSFCKGSLKGHFYLIILESDKQIMEKRILKLGYFSPFVMPEQPKLYIKCKSLNNFERGPTKEHSCEVKLKLVQCNGRSCHL